MDLTQTDTNITILCGVAMVIGVFGVVIPFLPGLLLTWASATAWAIFVGEGNGRWGVLALVTVIAILGIVVKYAWPGRNLKRSGIPNKTLLLGGVLAIVGFFVIPVIGLIIGFVAGIWLAELARLGDTKQAWPSTKHAIKAAGLAMLVELGAALAIAIIWVAAVVVS
ncbi:hypothetical protein Ais01nite_49160 [Asanoa ishikariensis]|uniref:DUF456 domain-containing protein n=1 Tax=Asanoa ishikariensis TaxID=137265 RepID=A0A1H3RSG4_9ACTN|nr:DUF456 domain-containing protein [Asanoa ishikariensis]GIF66881.1 hypothetical protein Ais01nite_49160 [Asanoa ishikariensis]SDZ28637.1 hypothetical protein SAMN05421684_4165 [Asanoa ishikariensis]